MFIRFQGRLERDNDLVMTLARNSGDRGMLRFVLDRWGWAVPETQDIERIMAWLMIEHGGRHGVDADDADVIKFFYRSEFDGRRLVSENDMDNAAATGRLEIVEFLHLNRTEGCTTKAMDQAASHGHYQVVVYLDRNRTEGCTTKAMDQASAYGCLDIVEYLDKHRTEGCTTKAMDQAAMNGHYNIVVYLDRNRTEGCTTDAMDYACEANNMDMVRFFDAQRTEGCTTSAMDNAAGVGNLEMVMYLHQHRTEGCSTNAMDLAAANGHQSVVEFLHSSRTEGCTTRAMDNAAMCGDITMVQYLHTNRTEGCTQMAMKWAANNGNYLSNTVTNPICETSFRNTIITRAHASPTRQQYHQVLEFLHSHRTEGISPRYLLLACRSPSALVRSAEKGYLEWVHAILARYPADSKGYDKQQVPIKPQSAAAQFSSRYKITFEPSDFTSEPLHFERDPSQDTTFDDIELDAPVIQFIPAPSSKRSSVKQSNNNNSNAVKKQVKSTTIVEPADIVDLDAPLSPTQDYVRPEEVVDNDNSDDDDGGNQMIFTPVSKPHSVTSTTPRKLATFSPYKPHTPTPAPADASFQWDSYLASQSHQRTAATSKQYVSPSVKFGMFASPQAPPSQGKHGPRASRPTKDRQIKFLDRPSRDQHPHRDDNNVFLQLEATNEESIDSSTQTPTQRVHQTQSQGVSQTQPVRSSGHKRKDTYYQQEDIDDDAGHPNTPPLTPTQPVAPGSASRQSSSLTMMFGLHRGDSFKKDRLHFTGMLKDDCPATQTLEPVNKLFGSAILSQLSQSITPTQNINIPTTQNGGARATTELIRSGSQLSFHWQAHDEIADDIDDDVEPTDEPRSPTPPKFEDNYQRPTGGMLRDKEMLSYNNITGRKDVEDIDDEPMVSDKMDGVWGGHQMDRIEDGSTDDLQSQFVKSMNDAAPTPTPGFSAPSITPGFSTPLSKTRLIEEVQAESPSSAQKPIKMTKGFETGGITTRLVKLLNKRQYNQELLATKRSASTTISHVPGHYDEHIVVCVTGLPSPLQPHVYVAQCVRRDVPTASTTLIPASSRLIVIFSMAMRTEYRLDIGTHVSLEYWQHVPSFDSVPTVICLAGKPATPVADPIDNMTKQMEQVSIDGLQVGGMSTQITTTSTSQEDNVLLNHNLVSIDDIHQNMTEINTMATLVKMYETTKDGLKMLVTNSNGAIASIEVPVLYAHLWKPLVESLMHECIFIGLKFVKSVRVAKASALGSALLHHIPASLHPNLAFCLTTLRICADTNVHIIRPNSHPHPAASRPIISVADLLNLTLHSSFWTRVAIQGTVAHIQKTRRHTTMFLCDAVSSGMDSVGVRVTNDLDISEIKAGDAIVIDCALILPPLPLGESSAPLLSADEFSTFGRPSAENQEHDQQDYSPVPPELWRVTENSAAFEVATCYESLVNIDGMITDTNKSDFIYRGCTTCYSQVAPFQTEHVLGYDGEGFFCPKCRVLVPSTLMVELRLTVKVGHSQCSSVFEFPLMHGNGSEYESVVVDLVGKLVNVNVNNANNKEEMDVGMEIKINYLDPVNHFEQCQAHFKSRGIKMHPGWVIDIEKGNLYVIGDVSPSDAPFLTGFVLYKSYITFV
eukprot:gene13876-16366_t